MTLPLPPVPTMPVPVDQPTPKSLSSAPGLAVLRTVGDVGAADGSGPAKPSSSSDYAVPDINFGPTINYYTHAPERLTLPSPSVPSFGAQSAPRASQLGKPVTGPYPAGIGRYHSPQHSSGNRGMAVTTPR